MQIAQVLLFIMSYLNIFLFSVVYRIVYRDEIYCQIFSNKLSNLNGNVALYFVCLIWGSYIAP